MSNSIDKCGALEKFSQIAAKIGNQIHLRTLRDSFATIIPLYVLAGVATLLNTSVFPLLLSGDALKYATLWCTAISNGTLNFCAVIICALSGYFLARNMFYKNPLACAVVSLSALIVLMPASVSATLSSDSKDSVNVVNALIFDNTGVKGLFAGIIVGLLASQIFIRLSSIEKLKIDLGEGIPPAVADTFNVLIPMLITLSIVSLFNVVLLVVFNLDLIALIQYVVQKPLAQLGTSLFAVLFIYSMGNLLFFLGIHQSTINGTLLQPILTVAISENMAAAAAGERIPHVLTMVSLDNFGQLGGTGCTICLIIATFIVGRNKASKAVCSMSILPGVFNINEPIIFGYPIVYNLSLLVPFILIPVLGIAIQYFATVLGLIAYMRVYIPWNTPPILSGFLATGGDIRAALLQAFIIVIGVLIYIPFVKLSERTENLQLAEEKSKQ
ncbi:PTS system, lactose/cellobiose family IIC subunit [Coriobacterium glomerans PW2]|uniref:Permease IIC component n=1 Tax=Coriobacterium glomerans (strain ATCC 49209 / DSM 20642 / JCM 10262 / PW2) TaxID=700015 RepID=F2N7T9_CORGP|nr:PTS transporter subunit EIIC [Coriobacterium glomerans]AEB07048.1 PTS system, lactose/cellobiose family IIC subunit [Coriobacterium glomerans PW2]